MKTVIVRRNRAHRTGLWLLCGAECLALAFLWGVWGGMDPALGLLCGTMAAACCLSGWAYVRFRVVFSREGIRWRGKLRAWTQVERAWTDRTHGEQDTLHIQFRDGATLRLRLIEENAAQALQMVCARCSIERR